MIIRRKSPIDGSWSALDLPVTIEQMVEFEEGERCAQDIFPDLTPDQREFIITGIFPGQLDRDYN
jgi:hypothetical protein